MPIASRRSAMHQLGGKLPLTVVPGGDRHAPPYQRALPAFLRSRNGVARRSPPCVERHAVPASGWRCAGPSGVAGVEGLLAKGALAALLLFIHFQKAIFNRLPDTLLNEVGGDTGPIRTVSRFSGQCL